jgi:nicotinamidase-related amidase
MQTDGKTALLVMDVQPSIVAGVADKDEYVDQVHKAVEGARAKNIPVFFVVVGFRPNYPEVSTHNKMFAGIREHNSSGMIEPSPIISPTQDELVITKRRVSAFAGSDLAVILSAQQITHLVLCGVATSGVVLSTTRQAADLDYQITILADLCRDGDPEVHKVLTEKVFPRQADVTTADAWLKTLVG